MSAAGRSSASAAFVRASDCCRLGLEAFRLASAAGRLDPAVRANPESVDEWIEFYLENPSAPVRQRILSLGGAQRANALVRACLAARGLCPQSQTPELPPNFLERFGSQVSALVRHQVARALAANRTDNLEDLASPTEAWPLVTGSWGFFNGLLSRFSGTERALDQTRKWLQEHPLPPLSEPFDQLDQGLEALVLGTQNSGPAADPVGFHSRTTFPSADATGLAMLAAGSKTAVEWLFKKQDKHGGWAQFDPGQNAAALRGTPIAAVPFVVDVPCPGVTGRALEALVATGIRSSDSRIQSAIQYLTNGQLGDGSWNGIWGGGSISATASALRGLARAGESDREAHMLRGTEWLRSIQNADGGWGESETAAAGAAPSTVSHTAWAIQGLLAGADTTSSSLNHGISWLCDQQMPNGPLAGLWTDCASTWWGPGFRLAPSVRHASAYAILALTEVRNLAVTGETARS